MKNETVITDRAPIASGPSGPSAAPAGWAAVPAPRAGFARRWLAGLARCVAVLLLGLALMRPAVAAEGQALLTLLEGEATLVVGSRAFAAAPGARLSAGALIETDPAASLLRLEWSDGVTLDLGPGTRIMLKPTGASARGPLFYLLQGWAKQSQAVVAGGQSSPAFEVAPFKGVLVTQIDDTQAVLFAESGGAPFTGRRSAVSVSLRAGESAALQGTASPQVSPRPSPGWLKELPRAFRETLPSRAAQLSKSAAPTLRAKAPLAYANLQHWLSAEPAVRRELPARFADLLQDRNFKDAVVARLSQHPEWEPLLRPPRPGATARKSNDPSDTEPPR